MSISCFMICGLLAMLGHRHQPVIMRWHMANDLLARLGLQHTGILLGNSARDVVLARLGLRHHCSVPCTVLKSIMLARLVMQPLSSALGSIVRSKTLTCLDLRHRGNPSFPSMRVVWPTLMHVTSHDCRTTLRIPMLHYIGQTRRHAAALLGDTAECMAVARLGLRLLSGTSLPILLDRAS